VWVHDPFWGIDTIRDAVKRGGSGPTWLMVLAGLVLIVLGVIEAPILILLGVLLVVIGGWPIKGRLRAGRDAARLQAHAGREDAILLLAGTIPAMSATKAVEARAQLAGLVAADASAAGFSHQECLRRAAHDPGAADSWFDVANEIVAATKTPAARNGYP
jgi:hypothetical protein